MTADLYPLQVLLVTLAGWVNRHQQHVIEYLVEENRDPQGASSTLPGSFTRPGRRKGRWIEFLRPTGVPNEAERPGL